MHQDIFSPVEKNRESIEAKSLASSACKVAAAVVNFNPKYKSNWHQIGLRNFGNLYYLHLTDSRKTL
jgi:hypothetical protein